MKFGNHGRNRLQLADIRRKSMQKVMRGNDKVKPNRYEIQEKERKEKERQKPTRREGRE